MSKKKIGMFGTTTLAESNLYFRIYGAKTFVKKKWSTFFSFFRENAIPSFEKNNLI